MALRNAERGERHDALGARYLARVRHVRIAGRRRDGGVAAHMAEAKAAGRSGRRAWQAAIGLHIGGRRRHERLQIALREAALAADAHAR